MVAKTNIECIYSVCLELKLKSVLIEQQVIIIKFIDETKELSVVPFYSIYTPENTFYIQTLEKHNGTLMHDIENIFHSLDEFKQYLINNDGLFKHN